MLSLRFRCTPPGLRQQLERPGELRTQADCAEVSTIRREDSIDVSSLGDGGDRAIDEADIELTKSRVELESSNDVGRQRRLIFVPCPSIEDFRDQLAHGCSVVPQNVVDF